MSHDRRQRVLDGLARLILGMSLLILMASVVTAVVVALSD